MNKYELVKDDTKIRWCGTTLYRVRYLIGFDNIKACTLGGYIRSRKNLSRYNNARVTDNALVTSNAIVADNAMVRGNAVVKDNAIVKDTAVVADNAMVRGNALITGNALVTGSAVVAGTAIINGNARVAGNVRVVGNARVDGDSICEKLDPINIVGLTYNVTITDNNIHIGCKTFELKRALKLASKWESTKWNYDEAEEIEAEKKIIVAAIKYRLYQLEQLSKEEGDKLC